MDSQMGAVEMEEGMVVVVLKNCSRSYSRQGVARSTRRWNVSCHTLRRASRLSLSSGQPPCEYHRL